MFRVPRSNKRIALAFVLAAWTQTTSASQLAAHINGEEIPTAAVDAMSIDQVRRIHGELLEAARKALEDLIDQRLGIDRVSLASRPKQRAELYRAHNVKLSLPPAAVLESALPTDQIVAVMRDEAIRAQALEHAAAVRLYRLRGELYLQRRRDLDRLIERRLVEIEAQRRGVSPQALEEALSKDEPVTDAEVQAFLARERSAGRNVEDPERVRPYLAFQKRYQRRTNVLQARRAETQIRIELAPPTRPRLPVDAREGVAFGSTDGPILVAYTNYACAICRMMHLELDRLLAATRPPRIVLRDFVHDPSTFQAAALVRCAARNARAAPMRRYLLQHEPPRTGGLWFDARQLESIAGIAGMNASSLRACLEAPEIRSRIEQDTNTALRLGFEQPPAFIAAGVPLSGMQPAQHLAEVLSGKADAPLDTLVR
jgi:protein-disulfide isomerase